METKQVYRGILLLHDLTRITQVETPGERREESCPKWTELNNETTTSLACGKERGLKRARPRNSFDSRENQCRVLKTKTFFFC